jgi:hypothetical protein
MYENYLLHPNAIAAVLNLEDKEQKQSFTRQDLREWLVTNNKNSFQKPKTQRSKNGTPKHLAGPNELIN